jgi:hypothetical protein
LSTKGFGDYEIDTLAIRRLRGQRCARCAKIITLEDLLNLWGFVDRPLTRECRPCHSRANAGDKAA